MTILEEKWEKLALRMNEELIRSLKERGILTDKRVEDALRRNPRHRFLTSFSTGWGFYSLTDTKDVRNAVEAAYADDALMIHFGRSEGPLASVSQPSIVVEMLQELEIEEGNSVLEIGTGSGWNAALIASIVGTNGKVVTLELSEELYEKAKERVISYDLSNVVTLVCTDGRFGYEPLSPYDRIICTAATDNVYLSWLSQLRIRGKLITPTDESHDFCPMLKIERRADRLLVKTLSLARFVPLLAGKGYGTEAPGIRVDALISAAENLNGIYRFRLPNN